MSAANVSRAVIFRLGEFHEFSGGGRRFLYTVPSAGIFELDDVSSAVLSRLSRGEATQEELIAIADVETVGELVDHLAARDAAHAAAFRDHKTIRCAVNQEFAAPSFRVRPGDEVAFFPPVTGG